MNASHPSTTRRVSLATWTMNPNTVIDAWKERKISYLNIEHEGTGISILDPYAGCIYVATPKPTENVWIVNIWMYTKSIPRDGYLWDDSSFVVNIDVVLARLAAEVYRSENPPARTVTVPQPAYVQGEMFAPDGTVFPEGLPASGEVVLWEIITAALNLNDRTTPLERYPL